MNLNTFDDDSVSVCCVVYRRQFRKKTSRFRLTDRQSRDLSVCVFLHLAAGKTFWFSVGPLPSLKLFVMIDKMEIEKYRQVVAKIYDYKSEMKERGMTMDDLEELREMSLSSDLIPRGFIDFGFFLFFVRCDKDFDKTVTLLHEYFKFANDWPELFSNRNFNAVDVKASLENQFYLVLPPSHNNCNVIFHHMSNYNPAVYLYDDVFKTLLMTIGKKVFVVCKNFADQLISFQETCLFNYGPREGFVMIIDMNGGRIGHLLSLKLNFVRRGMRFLQEACPVKIREIHILNTVSFLEMILGETTSLMSLKSS